MSGLNRFAKHIFRFQSEQFGANIKSEKCKLNKESKMPNELFDKYINSISTKFSHEETSEMGYRTDFEILIKNIFEPIKGLRILHDARASQGNKPDFIALSHDVPILYIEAKDINVSLDKVEKSDQMARYFGYANLVLTNYVEFRFYRNGLRYEEPIKIADYDKKSRIITPISENYGHVAKTLLDFAQSHKEPIRSGKHLAKIMGGKAQRIRDNVRQFLATESDKNSELARLFETMKKMLVHDMTKDSFADMYAQTLVYGLFVARYYDKSLGDFTRQEARELIPNSNPLLRHFFDHIVGADFDNRFKFLVDELCDVFSHADVQELMKEYFKQDLFGETHTGPDPVIHFYEDFLKEYDPDLRKKMGAYYTPLPVVQFIVRSVDHILEKEFGLVSGLANNSKLANGKHRVQVLDPATGTGTFLSAVIKIIYEKLLQGWQKGRWPAYVHNDLLPRLHGFELMMAPYTIAHLKLGIYFRQTGFWDFHRRLGIYLTNSLEESSTQNDLFAGIGFSESIAEESKEAAKIKNETPIMVVIGNPPYSGVSSNNTEYANRLVDKYKVEPGGKQKLQERKHWLNDDYVKFIALAEDMVAKTGDGIVAFITNHGYLDNPTFRGMRWHLMDTFDSIHVIDLHGNSKKKETTPDGGKDENVFDIQQGVSIMLAVKTGKKKAGQLAKVYRTDIWGKREYKFSQLDKLSVENAKWNLIVNRLPSLVFAESGSEKLETEYQEGFSINELFVNNSTGIVTMGDGFIIDENKVVLEKRVNDFLYDSLSEKELTQKFSLGKNYATWICRNKKEISSDQSKIIPVLYRPFDIRYTYFDNRLVWRHREKTMKNYLRHENLGLIFSRMTKGKDFAHIFVTTDVSEAILLSPLTGTNAFNAPLYLYSDDDSKTPNLKQEIVDQIEQIVGNVSPEDIFDYIYAVLHSPSYREKYKEFLKIDFPRVSYPKDAEQFKKLIAKGKELRELHLIESPLLEEHIISYPENGDDKVEKIEYRDGRVYINSNQYFGNVPEIAWNFYIGGYQPAQKWLKDRKGRTLTNEDIEHYQKMIISLTETDRIMKEIDKILFA